MANKQKRRLIRAIHERLAEREPEAMVMATQRRRAWFRRKVVPRWFGFILGFVIFAWIARGFSHQQLSLHGAEAAAGWHGLFLLVGCGLLALCSFSAAYAPRWSEPLRYIPIDASYVRRFLQRRWLQLGFLVWLGACASLYPFIRDTSATFFISVTSLTCMGLLMISGAFIWILTWLRVTLAWITLGLGLLLFLYSSFGTESFLDPWAMEIGLQTARYLPFAWPARVLMDGSALLPLFMITAAGSILFFLFHGAWRRSYQWNPNIEYEAIEPISFEPADTVEEETATQTKRHDWESSAREAWRKASQTNRSNGMFENWYRSLLTKRDLRVSQDLMGHPGPWTRDWLHTGTIVALMFLLTIFFKFLDLSPLPILLAVLLTIIVVIRTTLSYHSSIAFSKAAQGPRIEGPLYRLLPVSLQELFLLHWKALFVRHTMAMPWHFVVILLWQILLTHSANPAPLWGTLLQTACLTFLWASWSLAVFALVFVSHAYADLRMRPWFLRALLYLGSLATFIFAGILGLGLLALSAAPWFDRAETSLSEIGLVLGIFLVAITTGVLTSYFLPKLRIWLLHRLKHDCGHSRF